MVQSTSGREWRLLAHHPASENMILDTASADIAAGAILRIADCRHSATFQVADVAMGTGSLGGAHARVSYGAEGSANCTALRSIGGETVDSGQVLLGADATADCLEGADRSVFRPYRFETGSRIMPLLSTLLYIGRHRDTGEPALYRMDIAGNSARSYSEALVEGVENMRFRFGIDDDSDGFPDRWLGAGEVSDIPQTWNRVVGVRAWVLLRTPIDRGRARYAHPLRFPDSQGNLVDCREADADPVACPLADDNRSGPGFYRRVIERTFYLRNGSWS